MQISDDRKEVISMAEEWLKHLVDRIKTQDRESAEQTARAAREAKLFETEGPVFWRAFAGFLEKYVGDMKADFGEDVTLRQGELTFSFDSGNSMLKIAKVAFPYVNFTAQPNFVNKTVNAQYSKRNPSAQAQGIPGTNMPCRFELNQHGKVYLHLNGQEFHEPQAAARYVMEFLFALP